MCPGYYSTRPSKLMMFHNGTVNNNIEYNDVCKEKIQVKVAYINIPEVFEVDTKKNSVVEQNIHNSSNVRFKGEHSSHSFDWEILNNNKIEVDWLIAGGLNISNIKNALLTTKAMGVDVSSGVEISRGKKSPKLIKDFVLECKNIEKVFLND